MNPTQTAVQKNMIKATFGCLWWANYSPSPSQTLPTSTQQMCSLLANQPNYSFCLQAAASFCLDSVMLLFSSVKSKPRWFQHWTFQLGFCLSFLDTSSHNNERQKKKITLSFGANWFQYNCIKFPLILFPLSNCLRFLLWPHTCSPSGSITSSVCRGKHRFLGFQRSCSQKPCLFTSWNSWCLTWAHFQPWNLSFEPAPWGSFCGWFPFSSPKWRGPNFETWCHEEGRPSRHPPAWVSSSEGLRRLCTADPWEDVDAASGCAIKWYLQKRGRACPSFTRSPDVISPSHPALPCS